MPAKRQSTLKVGKYTLVEQIAEGGFGDVWRGHAADKREVAIKLIKRPRIAAAAREARARFSDETKAGTVLKDEHICEMLDYGEEEGRADLGFPHGFFFLVLEYIDGGSLRDALLARGSLPPATIPALANALASGLQRAHTNLPPIVHRDLKAENVLLPDGDVARAKLADFGISRAKDDTRLTKTGFATGTTIYMAPEQLSESWSVTPAADQYSLALLLWECMTGDLPDGKLETSALVIGRMRGLTLPSLEIGGIVAGTVNQVLARALHVTPTERYGSVREFVDALVAAGITDGLWEKHAPRASGFDVSKAALVILDHRTTTGGGVWVAGDQATKEILSVLFGDEAKWKYHRAASEFGSAPGWFSDSDGLTMPWEESEEEDNDTEADDEAADDSEKDEDAAFMRALKPSSDLAKIVGSKPLVRTEVVKKLWAYIQKHGLQDTKNKRMINADAKLLAVFGGKKRVSMFDMTRLVSKHLE